MINVIYWNNSWCVGLVNTLFDFLLILLIWVENVNLSCILILSAFFSLSQFCVIIKSMINYVHKVSDSIRQSIFILKRILFPYWKKIVLMLNVREIQQTWAPKLIALMASKL